MRRLLESLSKGISEVGAWMFFLIMLLIGAEVVGRYFLGMAIPGSIEMVQLMQVIGVGLCAAYAQQRRANVNVDLFINMAPRGVRNFLNMITAFLSLVIFALLTYGIFRISSTVGAMRETTDSLRIPLYPVKWLLGAGFAVVVLQLLVQLVTAIDDLIHGRDSLAADPHSDSAGEGAH